MVIAAFIWGILMGAFGFHKFVASHIFKRAKARGYKEGLADAVELKTLMEQAVTLAPVLKSADMKLINDTIQTLANAKRERANETAKLR